MTTMTMTYLAFIEGLGEEGFMPLKNASRVRKLIQLLDVIVLDIGPDHYTRYDGDCDDVNDVQENDAIADGGTQVMLAQ